jgi:hypothetical protein
MGKPHAQALIEDCAVRAKTGPYNVIFYIIDVASLLKRFLNRTDIPNDYIRAIRFDYSVTAILRTSVQWQVLAEEPGNCVRAFNGVE